jgi:hypothetical protein
MSKKKQEMQYMIVPMVVYRSKALSPDEKSFYQYVLSFSNNTSCFASKKTIAKETGININKIKAIRERLVEIGLIEVINCNNGETVEMVAVLMEDFTQELIDTLKGTEIKRKKKKELGEKVETKQEQPKESTIEETYERLRKQIDSQNKIDNSEIPQLKVKPNLSETLWF